MARDDDDAGAANASPSSDQSSASGDSPGAPPASLIHEGSPERLCAAARHPQLTEELALALLARRDLPGEVLESLSRNPGLRKSRRVLLAVVAHPRTPRHVSLPTARHLYNFELMQVALSPTVAADIKLAIEDVLLARLESVTAGERLALGRRASTRIAAALLCDPEQRIIDAALDNPHLTEAWIVRTLRNAEAPAGFVHAVCRHPKWSLRRDVQIAAIHNPHTPLARALAYAQNLTSTILRDLVAQGQISDVLKAALLADLESRNTRRE